MQIPQSRNCAVRNSFFGIVQLAARWTLNPKMKVRILLPKPTKNAKLRKCGIARFGHNFAIAQFRNSQFVLWDGVTGSTLRSERRNEGSTPSPAAKQKISDNLRFQISNWENPATYYVLSPNPQKGISILKLSGGVDGAIMFIRFVSAEIDDDSHLSVGLFCTVSKLLDEVVLPDYEYMALIEPLRWFGLHLKVPFDYRLEPASLAEQALCWFRSTAHEHICRAWEIVAILEERDIFMRTVKCHKTGYILYEDEAQVLAYPFADLRRRL